MERKQYTVGVLLFPDFEVLDVFGPTEAFGATRYPGQEAVDPTRPFNVLYLAEKAGPVRAGNGGGVQVVPDATIYAAPKLDIVMIPGGLGTRLEFRNQALIDWIRQVDSQVQLMTTVCTGAVLLAQTGRLSDRKATTNHAAFDWVVKESPQDIKWTKDLRWVMDGEHYVTAAGVSAGTDMACFLVQWLFGHEVAQATVKAMEYRWDSDPSHQPNTAS